MQIPIDRRGFCASLLAGVAGLRLESASAQHSSSTPFLERPQSGSPHKGKVLAAIQPHSDDMALLCAGTVCKLIQEGYTGYMIRATNDDMGDDVGEPGTVGENVLRNERELAEQTHVMGLKQDFAPNQGIRAGGQSRAGEEIRLRVRGSFPLHRGAKSARGRLLEGACGAGEVRSRTWCGLALPRGSIHHPQHVLVVRRSDVQWNGLSLPQHGHGSRVLPFFDFRMAVGEG